MNVNREASCQSEYEHQHDVKIVILVQKDGREYAKLIVNFSHESDVTSLDPFLFYYCVPHKIRRGILYSKPNADLRHLLDSLVSALAVYATAFRSKLSLYLETHVQIYTCTCIYMQVYNIHTDWCACYLIEMPNT